jgi:hypothetical protein
MSRAPSAFRQQDVTRALRAADAAGREVRRVEMHRDGKIVLVMVEDTIEGSVPKSDEIDEIVL